MCLQDRSSHGDIGHATSSCSPKLDALNLDAVKISTWESLHTEDVIDFLEKKHHANPPSVDTLAKILLKCRKEKDIGYAKRAHSYVKQHGLECHNFLGNYLVSMLVDCGSLDRAQDVFDRLAFCNEHAWSSSSMDMLHRAILIVCLTCMIECLLMVSSVAPIHF
jgi:hypothetical protein